MIKRLFISMVLCCFILLVLSSCTTTDNTSNTTVTIKDVTPTNIATNIPTDVPVNKPTDIPTITPTDIPSIQPTIVPILTPLVTLPADMDSNSEEALKDLSGFLPLQKCFLDYTFKVEVEGSDDYRTSYTVTGKYDLNSDGEEDNIDIQLKGRHNNLSYIEINQVKLIFNVDNPYDGEVHIVDLDKTDSYLEVACYDDGPSCDSQFILFRYDGSSIFEIGNIDANALSDGDGRLISWFHRNNYFKPTFCSAWYEIVDNALVRKNNRIDDFLGQTYDFAGGDAYFIPSEEVPEHPEIRWDEIKHFEAGKVKLIDILFLTEEERALDYYYIEFPNGEKGLIYFWIGD